MTLDVDSPPHCERGNEPEIEITPEMIEAGLRVFRAYDRRFDLDEEVVRDIIRQGMRASTLNNDPTR
jgi:hypothetical protein